MLRDYADWFVDVVLGPLDCYVLPIPVRCRSDGRA